VFAFRNAYDWSIHYFTYWTWVSGKLIFIAHFARGARKLLIL
jgi:hypothetical protein